MNRAAKQKKRNPARRGNDRQATLPSKVCAACGREFAWRKKWERDWARVKYCSKACARKGESLS
ncbi:MAG: DUF2256 domain-containing protein [Planctomycetota bacterium]